jgi:hypothetical protein
MIIITLLFTTLLIDVLCYLVTVQVGLLEVRYKLDYTSYVVRKVPVLLFLMMSKFAYLNFVGWDALCTLEEIFSRES